MDLVGSTDLLQHIDDLLVLFIPGEFLVNAVVTLFVICFLMIDREHKIQKFPDFRCLQVMGDGISQPLGFFRIILLGLPPHFAVSHIKHCGNDRHRHNDDL